MPDLDTQLRNLADHRAAQVPDHPLEPSEASIATEAQPDAGDGRGRRSWMLAAAAVTIAVLGVFGAAWLTAGGPDGLPTLAGDIPVVIPERGLVERQDWARPLADLATESTFVLARVGGDDPVQVAVADRALERFRPASTYKLVNALLFLEDGIVTGLFDDTLPWDGVDRGVSAWNRDQTLASALQDSAVWAFEHWAMQLDPDTVQTFLDEVNYGNRDIGDGSGTYWLEGNLEISALEQVAFLEAMVAADLPVDQQNQADVLGNLTAGPELPRGGIRYKTGTSLAEPRPVAWLVGFVKTATGTWVFALNADLPVDESGVPQAIAADDRVAVMMELLRAAEIID